MSYTNSVGSLERQALLLLIRLLLYELWKQIIIQFSRFLMGWIMNLKKQRDIESVYMCGLILVPNNINNPIFTIFIVCATILSAVEGLNG